MAGAMLVITMYKKQGTERLCEFLASVPEMYQDRLSPFGFVALSKALTLGLGKLYNILAEANCIQFLM